MNMVSSREDMPDQGKKEEFDLVVKAMKLYGASAYVNFETGEIMTEEDYNQELYNPTGIRLDDFIEADDWCWDNIEPDDDGEYDDEM